MSDKKELIGKRSRLFRKLLTIRDILPGALSERKITCGTKTCKCLREGKKHTVYQYFYKLDPEKKGVTKMIPKELSNQVERQVKDNKEFKKTVKKIQKINLQILAELLQARKKK